MLLSAIFSFVKIAVTKLKEKSEGIYELFERYDHEAILIPTMISAEPTDSAPLSQLSLLIANGAIDILIFTSALGVDKLFTSVMPPKTIRIVSVGPKTAKKVEEYGFKSEVINSFSSEHFAEYLGDIRGKTVGIARAEVPNQELTESLKSKGAFLFEAAAYRLETSKNNFVNFIKDVDAVIFTSAKSFESSGFNKSLIKNIKVIAIGEKTAKAMRKSGVVPDVVGNGSIENCLELLS
jgi:uroporphyrinogen-III synthase